MKFTPYNDEIRRIDQLKKYVGTDYTILRLTDTMITKNNIDANYFMRSLLKRKGVVDYDKLINGGSNGQKVSVLLFSRDCQETTKTNLYRVNGRRSDPRFSIYGIKKYAEKNILRKGDLLVIFPYQIKNTTYICMFNVSSSLPQKEVLSNLFELNETQKRLNILLDKIKILALLPVTYGSKPSTFCISESGASVHTLQICVCPLVNMAEPCTLGMISTSAASGRIWSNALPSGRL